MSIDAASLLREGPVLLYDGECGVCSRSVQWVLRHEKSQTLRFAALQSAAGQTLREAAGIDKDIDSVLWIEQDESHKERARGLKWSDAVVKCIVYVGGLYRALSVIRFIPRPLRDAAYRLFARYRTVAFARACLVPTPQERSRFLAS